MDASVLTYATMQSSIFPQYEVAQPWIVGELVVQPLHGKHFRNESKAP